MLGRDASGAVSNCEASRSGILLYVSGVKQNFTQRPQTKSSFLSLLKVQAGQGLHVSAAARSSEVPGLTPTQRDM